MPTLTSFPINTTDKKATEQQSGLCPYLRDDVNLNPTASTSGVNSEYGVRKGINTFLNNNIKSISRGNGASFIKESAFDDIDNTYKVRLKSISAPYSSRFSITSSDGNIHVLYSGGAAGGYEVTGKYIQGGSDYVAKFLGAKHQYPYSQDLGDGNYIVSGLCTDSIPICAHMERTNAIYNPLLSGDALSKYNSDISLGKIVVRIPVENAFNVSNQKIWIGKNNDPYYYGYFNTKTESDILCYGEWVDFNYTSGMYSDQYDYITNASTITMYTTGVSVSGLTYDQEGYSGSCEVRCYFDKVKYKPSNYSDTTKVLVINASNQTDISKWFITNDSTSENGIYNLGIDSATNITFKSIYGEYLTASDLTNVDIIVVVDSIPPTVVEKRIITPDELTLIKNAYNNGVYVYIVTGDYTSNMGDSAKAVINMADKPWDITYMEDAVNIDIETFTPSYSAYPIFGYPYSTTFTVLSGISDVPGYFDVGTNADAVYTNIQPVVAMQDDRLTNKGIIVCMAGRGFGASVKVFNNILNLKKLYRNMYNTTSFGYNVEYNIEKLNFSNEIVTLNSNSRLTVSSCSHGVISNNNYVYIAGGIITPSTVSTIDTIQRYNSITETSEAINRGILTSPRKDISTYKTSTKMYFTGGYNSLNGAYNANSEFVSFASDTINSVLNLTLTTARSTIGCVYNNNVIYLAGGNTGLATYAYVDKINTSDDTTSTAFALTTPKMQSGRFNTKVYGYLTGGSNTTSVVNNIAKINYNTDSISDYSGKLLLPYTGMKSIQNNVYGYMCGGSNNTAMRSDIQRINFSTDTVNIINSQISINLSLNEVGTSI